MNRLPKILSFLCALGLLAGFSLRAETFEFKDGSSVTGDIISKDEHGIKMRLPEGTYTDVIPWSKFTQADLLRLKKDPKMEPFVTPFLEISEARRTTPTPIGPLREPERLPRPTSQSVIATLFGSPLGWVLLLLIYGANLYAAKEVALFRSQPTGTVCGVAAILPLVGPIIFLAMPTKLPPPEAEPVKPAAVDDGLVANPMQADVPVSHPTSLHLHEEASTTAEAEPAALPPPEVFARGQFTFNRRFFETRFPKFFGVHHGADKDKVIVVKSARKEYVTERIVRATATEIVVQITRGTASEEATIPFLEIQEVIFKHRNAP